MEGVLEILLAVFRGFLYRGIVRTDFQEKNIFLVVISSPEKVRAYV